MLSLEEIKRFYPEYLYDAGEFLIREYLQYKILEIVYESDYAHFLSFFGGTCLRIIHGNYRFSEDLDFDNLGLNKAAFSQVAGLIKKGLEQEGYETEIQVIHKNAFRCNIRFPGLLFREGLTGHKEQKILIQIDTKPQNYVYTPASFLLNKFDVFTEVFATPLSTILAQKFFAVLNRKRNKGRDFYDITFLLGMDTTPDWNYLNQKIEISSQAQLLDAVLKHCEQIDMNEMANDVEPFLFQAKDAKKVAKFPQYIEQKFGDH